MRRFFLITIAFVFGTLMAQETSNEQGKAGSQTINNNVSNSSTNTIPYWKAILPGGEYVVKLSAIETVSSQQYTVDGVARVTEVNIATSTVFQPRFYYIEQIQIKAPGDIPGAQAVVDRAQTMAEEILNRSASGDSPWKKVVKNYPTTTHAGTIEFRLDTLEQVQRIARSAERAWITGHGEIFTIDGTRPFSVDEVKKYFEGDPKSKSSPEENQAPE